VLSQVILSLQLSFAVFPLVSFTSDRRKMGNLVSPVWVRALAWMVAVIIAVLNAVLLYQTFFD
jgi:manganese transport protein